MNAPEPENTPVEVLPPLAADQNARLAAFNEKLLREQNLFYGIAAGLLAALMGATLWMLVVLTLHVQAGLVALAIGAGVGYAVRSAGRGVTRTFGVVGAILTLLGCFGGETFAIVGSHAELQNDSFFRLLFTLNLAEVIDSIITSSSPITYLIYAIGAYEGYQFSIRRVTQQELQEAGLMPPGGQ
jgi:hypothetical protein